ncbi:hypothetical protein GLYMA_03G256600v4 [Glycine max]|nr:hypothetical protein GLYMA_03G256600v4 [Glycine max]
MVMGEEGCKVCVTGGSGYIGSWLIKKLLAKGYTVHATLRDLKNESKVGLLKSLPQSEGKLVLFEADIYNPNDFDLAIEGCKFVFHVATPMIHEPGSQGYTYSKTLSERHVLSYGNEENGGGMEVVTLTCGLVGGDTLLSSTPASGVVCIAQIMQNERAYISLKFLKELLGKIPLVHVDDVCEAHIFCMESTSISGRFLCASSYISLEEMANHYALHYPEFNVKQEYEDGLKKDIKWASTKLCDKGFVYKYDAKMLLDDCIKCARRMGDI